MKAKDLMTKNVVTCCASESIEKAAAVLAEKKISGLPVVDGKGYILGVLSEVDIITRQPEHKTVGDVMTRTVIAVNEDTPIERIAAQIAQHRIKRVPVTRDGVLVGIVTRSDLVRAMAEPAQAAETLAHFHHEGGALIWRCNKCGNVEPRRDPLPDACPHCGAPREHFEFIEED
jgi:CBS-domain-containing membrane protein